MNLYKGVGRINLNPPVLDSKVITICRESLQKLMDKHIKHNEDLVIIGLTENNIVCEYAIYRESKETVKLTRLKLMRDLKPYFYELTLDYAIIKGVDNNAT